MKKQTMAIAPLSLRKGYWEELAVQDTDLEFLYNHLLEKEIPLTSLELAQVLVNERIRIEKQSLEEQKLGGGPSYLPKNHYEVGQQVSFPAFDWQAGEVTAVRPGVNPQYEPFDVIQVRMANGETKEFAAGIEDHKLNNPIAINMDDPALNTNQVLRQHGNKIAQKLDKLFEANEDLVCIAGRWFPRSLLVDVNIGYLNLAEAVLEMEGGGPLSTHQILEQIELPTDVNTKLTEFSLNLALQEDGRFDEVGPAGEVIWFLRRLEPEEVQKQPAVLKFQGSMPDVSAIAGPLADLERLLADELEISEQPTEELDELTISLIYPHWRAGTLPLTQQLTQFFPTAYESPRVQFTFVDNQSGERFNGWVVRPNLYIYGLREWYEKMELFPGAIVTIKRGAKAGEVIVKAGHKRSTKEWIRTVLVGADGGVVFAMLKQQIAATYDERMAVAIADDAALNSAWEQAPRQRLSMDQSILAVMRELTKLNPQGQVHAQELYAAVNTIRRCPPAQVLNFLVQSPKAIHLGDLYFRLDESKQGEKAYE